VSASRTIISAIAAAFRRGFRKTVKDLGKCPISLLSHAGLCEGSRRSGKRVTVTVDENQEGIGGIKCNSISIMQAMKNYRMITHTCTIRDTV
jgi:hypothetical protein